MNPYSIWRFRMRKFAIKSANPEGDGETRSSVDDGKGWFRRQWRLISLLVIIIAAFVVRFVFAFGVSAGDNFALSGGSGAASHVHVIESLISGSFSFTDSALNYPYGATNVYPPLMDFILAGVAGLVSLFGVSTSTAASGVLAFSTPIFAALTCYPVYLVGKKMFNDENIGILSALLYAFFALLIMTTVFSNGTEYAFIAFVFVFMIYFLLKALEACDDSRFTGLNAVVKDRSILKNTLITGILFVVIALSWNQFRVILLMLVFFMVAQALIDRFRSKEVSLTVGMYSVVILMGIVISAPYYIGAGLWTEIFSGPFIIGILAVALAVLFAKTASKPWVLMIPVIVAIVIAFFAILFFGAHDLFSAIIYGNSIYEGSLMKAIISSTHTTVSEMAHYYGWVTAWLPLILFLYMIYNYRKNMDSRKYTFIMWWTLAMFCIGWYNTGYAVIAGPVFAVASAVVIIKTIRAVDLKSYLSNCKGNGLKAGFRKALKPIPLAAVIIIVALIIIPNFTYGVEAGVSTNTAKDNGYFTGDYTISTTDVSSVNKLWESYSDMEKTGALVTYFGYSNDAVYKGGFDSVTDTLGGGASAAANVLLSSSSASATAVLAIRIMMAGGISNFSSEITAAGLDYTTIAGYINNPSTAVKEVLSDSKTYSGIDADVTEENAVYLVLTNYITTELSEPQIDDFYDKVCGEAGDRITYVSVNGSMLPLYYQDGSYFSTIAYFGDYILNSYSAATQFYSYNTSTGYAEYTDAMYETFLWKSIIGITETDAGYSSTVSFLSALSLSDGTLKAVPGYGLSNYSVAYWHVSYNANKDATLSSSGWEDMDAYEAIALQNSQGGLINYLSGVVMLEYNTDSTTTYSGVVDYTTGSGASAAAGIQVAVYVDTDYDSSGVTNYVLRNVTYTKEDGSYSISVPNDGTAYRVVFSSGATGTQSGSIIATYTDTSSIPTTMTIAATSLSGTVVVGDDAYTEDTYVVITGKSSGYTTQVETINGVFSFTNIVPDVYTATVYSTNGTTINTATLTACVGTNSGAKISTTSGTITVTVTDEYGESVTSGTVIATNSSTGATFSATISDGTATISVIPATYSISASGGKVSVSSTSVTVTSGGTKTATLSVYDSKIITVSGAPSGSLITLMSFGYTISSATSTSFAVPASGGYDGETYTAYAVSGSTVYYGVSTGASISMISSTGYTVSGILKNSSGAVTAGTVSFITSTGAQLIFTADSDGVFSAMIPAGSYTLYAYDGSASALLKSITVSADDVMGDLKMSAGRTLTGYLYYTTQMSSSSTKGIAFVDMKCTLDVDGTSYTIVYKTNSSGKALFYVPSGYEAKISVDAFDTTAFYCEAQTTTIASGSSSTSTGWTLGASSAKDSTKYVKSVSISSPYTTTLTLYSDSTVKYTVNGSTTVMPGQYTAIVLGSTGYYYNGTVYVYPGQSGALEIDAISVATVTLTASVLDQITVTAVENDDGVKGSYYEDSSNSLVYYVQKGYSYYFEAESGSTGTETIAYGSIDNASSAVTLDLSQKSEKATITGYVGVVADGTLTVTYGSVSIPFDITNGSFTIVVPSGTALTLKAVVSQTIDKRVTYTYTGTTSMIASAVVNEAVANFSVLTTGQELVVAELSGSSQNFSNGVGSFILSIENTGSTTNTYVITSGSAWVLDKTYTIVVAAGATGTVLVTGYYDKTLVGAGNSNLSVIVTDISGNTVGTYLLDGTGFSSSSTTPTYVDISGTDGASSDAVNSHEYQYAITITNNDCYQKSVTISATFTEISTGWVYVLSNKDGSLIYSDGASYNVKGYGTTTIYVKVMCSDASSSVVPGMTITVSSNGLTLATNSSGVTISGSTATTKLSAQEADMDETAMSASGTNIFNSASTVPIMFWVLLALCVLVLIFTAWAGTKRGVFVRKK